MRVAYATWAALALAVCATACGGRDLATGDLTMRSPAFGPGQSIPKRHARKPDGENVSPALEWQGVPEGAKELVLVVEDPAPLQKVFVHWVAYGISPTVHGIREGIPVDQMETDGLVQGTNDLGSLGWCGPFPPPGEPAHKYWFWLYAVDRPLHLPPGATKDKVVEAMGHHILANGRLVGLYGR